MIKLTDDNYILQCMRHYDKVSVLSVAEFEEDISRVKYIRKLLTRQLNGEEVSERLVLNHIIILYNLFNEFATEILFYRVSNEQLVLLNTYLFYLGRLTIQPVPPLDMTLLDKLKQL